MKLHNKMKQYKTGKQLLNTNILIYTRQKQIK